MSQKIKKVCVIGTGKLSIQCAILAKEKNLPVALYDMGQTKSAMIENQAKSAGIPFSFLPPKEVFQKLRQETEPLLLVSAINERIIPNYVLEQENIRAVNLHQALLPAHPGRNAEAWAIFEQDKQAGVTWHEITAEVDGGKILIQKEIPLDKSITAFRLFQKQIAAAYEAFLEIFDGLAMGTLKGTPQKNRDGHKMHYKKDVPGEGFLDLRWSGDKISAFLRALDYAGLAVFEKPMLCYGSRIFQWKKYEIQPARGGFPKHQKQQTHKRQPMLFLQGNDIIIRKEHCHIILKDYKAIEMTNEERLVHMPKTSENSPAS